jgi:hypothetical protein
VQKSAWLVLRSRDARARRSRRRRRLLRRRRRSLRLPPPPRCRFARSLPCRCFAAVPHGRVALAAAVVGSAVGAARFGCCHRSLARCRAAASQPCCAGASRCSRQPLRATAFSRCRCGLRAFTASALQAGLGHSQHPSALLAGLGHSQHPWRPTRRARLRLLLGARANHRGPRPFAVPLCGLRELTATVWPSLAATVDIAFHLGCVGQIGMVRTVWMCVRQARPNLFGGGSGAPASRCRVFTN